MSARKLSISPRASLVSATPSPLDGIGRKVVAVIEYLGALALLPVSAVRASGSIGALSRAMPSAVVGELAWMIATSLPLVALASVGMGSFLAMQSYFGGTFVDGTGAVVGVGLIRYLGPLIAGLTLSGLCAARIIPEIGRPPERVDQDRGGFPLVVARLVAGGICGFVMSVWASAVGTLAGWRMASALIGVSTHTFFSMLFDMLWIRDVVGLLVKGSAFGFVAAWLACHEGLRLKREPNELDRLVSTSTAACRSASLSMLAVLLISGAWFLLLYHAGLPFGPTLLTPPNS